MCSFHLVRAEIHILYRAKLKTSEGTHYTVLLRTYHRWGEESQGP